jgi:hypothetical protein
MPDPNEKPKSVGPNSLNMDIIQVSDEGDTRGSSAPNTNNLGPGIAIVEMGGEEDTRIRPYSEYLRELREREEKRKKENGETGSP